MISGRGTMISRATWHSQKRKKKKRYFKRKLLHHCHFLNLGLSPLDKHPCPLSHTQTLSLPSRPLSQTCRATSWLQPQFSSGHHNGPTWQLPLSCLPPRSSLAGWRQLHPRHWAGTSSPTPPGCLPGPTSPACPQAWSPRGVHESGAGVRSGVGTIRRRARGVYRHENE